VGDAVTQAYSYLIIGGGMTADAAVRGIRELDAKGAIGLIGSETDEPYSRPPLSKALWKGSPSNRVAQDERGRRPYLPACDDAGPAGKRVLDDRGAEYTYDKLLLATGGTPRRLPFGGDSVIYFRTLEDYRRLHAMSEPGRTFVVIGGGFIGPKSRGFLAMQGTRSRCCSLRMNRARLFPADLARFLVILREKGVDVRPGEQVTDVSEIDGRRRDEAGPA
jgi:NAD(P)H-nitrite reductase large subunit